MAVRLVEETPNAISEWTLSLVSDPSQNWRVLKPRLNQAGALVDGALPCGRRWRADLIVRVPLLERSKVLEDIERDLERRARDLDMRGPAAQLLIARDAPCQDIDIDRRKE